MQHDWGFPSAMHEGGARATRTLAFCHACGLLRVTFVNMMTGRTSELLSRRDENGEMQPCASDPGCNPSPRMRTERAKVLNGGPRRAYHGDIIQSEAPLSRREWRALCNVARTLHVARYTGGPSDPFSRSSETWCKLSLYEVPWITERLTRETTIVDEGDAICVVCARESRKSDKRRELMLRSKA